MTIIFSRFDTVPDRVVRTGQQIRWTVWKAISLRN